MPPSRVAQNARPGPFETPAAFTFPKDHHLIVTTERCVWSWDARGLTNAFRSGSGGILAAKEAKDGSGLLAVADDQVVVLHDANRGMKRSYRLKGTEGRIRLLEYSNDSKNLFFTTTLQNAVQSYSLRQACLLEPSHTHPSPPTVLAISHTSHLLLSGSEKPPTIYLQNLTLRTPSVSLHPRASDAAVEIASFHPERPNVFLLAFKDGTLAAYDATRILGRAGRGGTGGEVGALKNLHNVTSLIAADKESDFFRSPSVGRSVSITGAAFLPGHRSRAISVGADGRCRLVDFDRGGTILRTWHVKGPATSLSILSVPARPRSPVRQKAGNAARSNALGDALNNTIAIGRQDGKVLLFDSVGLLLTERTIDAEAGRIVDVQWMKGPGLKPSKESSTQPATKEALIDRPDKKDAANVEFNSSETLTEENQQPAMQSSSIYSTEALDDAYGGESGTVNYTPSAEGVGRALPLPPVGGVNYMDLFSPVKPVSPPRSPQRKSPRPRNRPRILSSTFRQSSISGSPERSREEMILGDPPHLPPRGAGISEAEDRGDGAASSKALEHEDPLKQASYAERTASPSPSSRSEAKLAKTPSKKNPLARKGRRVSQVRMPGSFRSTSTLESTSTSTGTSSKILADIRRLGDSGSQKGGLALLAPYMNSRENPHGTPSTESLPKPNKRGQEDTNEGAEEPVLAESSLANSQGPTERSEDIWLTSDDETSQSRHRLRARSHRIRSHRNSSVRKLYGAPHHIPAHPRSPPPPVPSDRSPDTAGAAHAFPKAPSLLPPGAALSPKGPVPMDEFFPRRGSLPSSSHRGRSSSPDSKQRVGGAMANETAWGHEAAREGGCECGSSCCAALRRDVRAMGEELRFLREQVDVMRAMMMG
ncbi:quinon protein alcohol dehydrogenase-like superfamily [Phyllosticta citrichinensis]|uniref:Quinon protein alcohol dehydrogenase-like superfamily n=1 Tax=Phyllosticta citrichinensis TaxID=1130410 RepID=A0ABR1XZJ2_9PEZI